MNLLLVGKSPQAIIYGVIPQESMQWLGFFLGGILVKGSADLLNGMLKRSKSVNIVYIVDNSNDFGGSFL